MKVVVAQFSMTDSLQVGPLLLPFSLLTVFASAAVAFAVTEWFGRRVKVQATDSVWRALVVGLIVARLMFVFQYSSLYFVAPLSIIDIRDGGWSPEFGLVAAWLFALSRAQNLPNVSKPLYWGLAAGSAVFILATAVSVLSPPDDRPLPSLVLQGLNGEPVDLQGFVGKPLVINLWATWCPPCVREMPVLQQAQSERDDVTFVFANQGEAAGKVADWLQSRGLHLGNVLLDPSRQASATFKQQGYPTTLFFNRQGRLVTTHLGELSPATLSDRLARIEQ